MMIRKANMASGYDEDDERKSQINGYGKVQH